MTVESKEKVDYTPEPWYRAEENESRVTVRGADGVVVCHVLAGGIYGPTHDNASRVIAAWNATRGLTVRQLDSDIIGRMIEALEAALKMLDFGDRRPPDAVEKLRAVLAEVRGKR